VTTVATLAVLTLSLSADAHSRISGAGNLPLPAGMQKMTEGSVCINGVRARYFLFKGRISGSIYSYAGEVGWKPAGRPIRGIPTPDGGMELGVFEDGGGRMILLCAPEDSAGGESWLAMALFERKPEWMDGRGEAPGHEPAGVPRIAASRRLLHLSGDGFEAAWYSSHAPAASVLAEGLAVLRSRGWTVSPAREGALLAVRRGEPSVALHARDSADGSRFLIIASGREQ